MLDEKTRGQLATVLARTDRPIEMVFSGDGTGQSADFLSMLREVVDVSGGRVSLSTDGTHRRVPSVSIGNPGRPHRVRFSGMPTGHEFTSFALAIIQAGGIPPRVSPAEAERMAAVPPCEIETFVSMSCHNCPDVVQAMNSIAAINPSVSSETIDGASFQREAEDRGVMAVPMSFSGGETVIAGRASLLDILDRMAPRVAPAPVDAAFDVVVVGGGPAAVAASVYSARKGLSVAIVSENVGGQTLDTAGIENLVSAPRTTGPEYASQLAGSLVENGVATFLGRRAARLEPGMPSVVVTEGGDRFTGKAVIVATGARWRELGVPGEREYRGRGVAYCPHCDGPLFKGKPVVVVGGGNSGVEAAIDLSGLASHVTLIEFSESLGADAILIGKLRSLGNVTVLTSARTTAIDGDGERVTGVSVVNLIDGASSLVEAAGVFVQIGLTPNTGWLGKTVALNGRGEIEIDSGGATSTPMVFAAGDCTNVPYKQIAIAVGEGAKAAISAFTGLWTHSSGGGR